MCGNRYKITCIDDDSGYCRSNGACVVMTVTNACPQYNPCNSCKGEENPCRPGRNHVDLCDKTFDAIAYRDKQPKEGIRIHVEKTDLPEGPCGGNEGFNEVSQAENSEYWAQLQLLGHGPSVIYPDYVSEVSQYQVCKKVKKGHQYLENGWRLMTVADVWKDRMECFLEERDVVALADG